MPWDYRIILIMPLLLFVKRSFHLITPRTEGEAAEISQGKGGYIIPPGIIPAETASAFGNPRSTRWSVPKRSMVPMTSARLEVEPKG